MRKELAGICGGKAGDEAWMAPFIVFELLITFFNGWELFSGGYTYPITSE